MKKKTFKLFAETDLDKIFKSEDKIFIREIKNEFAKKSLNINEKELIAKYYKEYYFKPLKIDFSNMKESQYVDKKLNMLFYVYCIPFRGSPDLLKYNPITGISGWTLNAYLEEDYLCFEKKTYLKNSEDFTEEVDEIIEVIKEETIKINKDVEEYNFYLKNIIKKTIKEKIKSKK